MPPAPLTKRLADGSTVPRVSGLACVLVGVLIVAVRLAGFEVSILVPRLTSGAMFAVAGGSLLAAAHPSLRSRPVRRVLAGLVLAIALGCLIDRVVSGHMTVANDGGAISPIPTVVAFLLMGTAFMSYGARRTPLAYLPVAATGAIVFTGLTGYALGLRPEHSVLAGMSPTSLVFLGVLAIGTLGLWPHLPPFSWVTQHTPGARLARQLVPVMVLLPLALGLLLPHWEELTGLPEAAGLAVAVALLGTVLTGLTAISVRAIDGAELRGRQLRQLAEQAIRESERQFRTLALEMPVGVIQRDEDGWIEFANDEAFRIFGLPPGSPPDALVADLVDPADLREAMAAMRTTIATGEPHEQDGRIILPTGEVRWVHLRGTRQDDGDGHFMSYLSTVVDITDRRRYERQLQHLANHDPLTGLLNRRAFEERMEAHVARVSRYGGTGTLLMLDLDGFKGVNDRLGHALGDALLVGVAGALTERLRESDVIARLGGDEFAIVLPEQSPEQAREVAASLLTLVRENARMIVPAEGGPVSTSIGLAGFEQGAAADVMLRRADQAMYAAKQSGKDCVAEYERLHAA